MPRGAGDRGWAPEFPGQPLLEENAQEKVTRAEAQENAAQAEADAATARELQAEECAQSAAQAQMRGDGPIPKGSLNGEQAVVNWWVEIGTSRVS